MPLRRLRGRSLQSRTRRPRALNPDVGTLQEMGVYSQFIQNGIQFSYKSSLAGGVVDVPLIPVSFSLRGNVLLEVGIERNGSHELLSALGVNVEVVNERNLWQRLARYGIRQKSQ